MSMDRTRFLEELLNVLQREEPLAADMPLADIAEWDSLSIMSCMTWFSKTFKRQTSYGDYEKLGTVADLMALAGV